MPCRSPCHADRLRRGSVGTAYRPAPRPAGRSHRSVPWLAHADCVDLRASAMTGRSSTASGTHVRGVGHGRGPHTTPGGHIHVCGGATDTDDLRIWTSTTPTRGRSQTIARVTMPLSAAAQMVSKPEMSMARLEGFAESSNMLLGCTVLDLGEVLHRHRQRDETSTATAARMNQRAVRCPNGRRRTVTSVRISRRKRRGLWGPPHDSEHYQSVTAVLQTGAAPVPRW